MSKQHNPKVSELTLLMACPSFVFTSRLRDAVISTTKKCEEWEFLVLLLPLNYPKITLKFPYSNFGALVSLPRMGLQI